MINFEQHDNVIQDVEFIYDIPAITMELIEHGDLSNFLKNRNSQIGSTQFYWSDNLDWHLRMKWSMQLSNALLFLHINGIIHSK